MNLFLQKVKEVNPLQEKPITFSDLLDFSIRENIEVFNYFS